MKTQKNTIPDGDCLTVSLPKERIEWDLSCFAPEVRVSASQIVEDGWVVMLEGDGQQLDFIRDYWAGVLVEGDN